MCIDCHQCASKDDGSIPPFCTDPYDGDEMADNIDGCDDKDTHCLKSKSVSYLNDAGFILGAPRGMLLFYAIRTLPWSGMHIIKIFLVYHLQIASIV